MVFLNSFPGRRRPLAIHRPAWDAGKNENDEDIEDDDNGDEEGDNQPEKNITPKEALRFALALRFSTVFRA